MECNKIATWCHFWHDGGCSCPTTHQPVLVMTAYFPLLPIPCLFTLHLQIHFSLSLSLSTSQSFPFRFLFVANRSATEASETEATNLIVGGKEFPRRLYEQRRIIGRSALFIFFLSVFDRNGRTVASDQLFFVARKIKTIFFDSI